MNAPEPWPEGHGCIIRDILDSTNSEAQRMAGNISAPTWILALRQTRGRARRGRVWKAADGNFAASLVFRPNQTMERWAQHSFVAALALHDVLTVLAPETEIGLKWPNDVLMHRRKVSGILLETSRDHLVIGIGVNLATAPTDEPNAVALSEFAPKPPDPEEFLSLLAPAIARWQCLLDDKGFAEIRRAWLARAVGLGQQIEARLPNVIHSGVFEDIDEDGALILNTQNGRLVLAAGDVYFSATQGS